MLVEDVTPLPRHPLQLDLHLRDLPVGVDVALEVLLQLTAELDGLL